jgi:hypothetical protein
MAGWSKIRDLVHFAGLVGEVYLRITLCQVLLSGAGEEYLTEGDSQVHLSGSSTPLWLFYGHNLIILSKFSAGVLGSERCTMGHKKWWTDRHLVIDTRVHRWPKAPALWMS